MFYGWWLCIIFFLGLAFNGVTVFHGFTTLFDPLMKEFGWSYTAISFGASIRGVEIGLVDVVSGVLIDRLGGRRVILVGAILLSLGFLSLSRMDSLLTFYVSWVIISIGGSGFGAVAFFVVLGQWFRRRLGLAIGLASAGVGAGGFLVPLMVYMLDKVGFRDLFLYIAALSIAAGLITFYFVRNRPGDRGTTLDGVPLSDVNQAQGSESRPAIVPPIVAPRPDYTFKEATSTSTFWIVTIVMLLCQFSIMMIITHIMPYLELIGYSRGTASLVAMALPVISISGRLLTGWISDLVNHKFLFLFIVLAEASGIVLLLFARLEILVIPAVILFGLAWGGIVVLRPAALGSYFGSKNMGSLLGLSSGLCQAGSIGGPLFAGWVMDTNGNYTLAFIAGIVLLLVSLPAVLALKSHRKHANAG